MAAGGNAPAMVNTGDLDVMIRHALGRHARLERAIPLGGGQINDTRLLTLAGGRQFVMRVAPSERTAAAGPSWFTPYGLRREAAVIAAASGLAPYLPVTIAHDFGHAVIERDWVIQEVMPGRPLLDIDNSLPPDTRASVWEQVGDFTRRLHAVQGDHFGPPAWGLAFARWSELLAWDAGGMVRDADRFGLPVPPFIRLATLVDRFAPVLDEVTTPALIHSDLWKPHIFVEETANGEARLAGVIDLEFGRFADPLSEHLLPTFDWGNVPPAMRHAFRRGYGAYALKPGDEVRCRIYLAIGLSWTVTLLAWQRRPTAPLLSRLRREIEGLDRMENGAV